MAATALATARTSAYTALATITTAQTYRRRQRNYQYPCFVVGWPVELDARPAQGEARDFTLNIYGAAEVTDDDSSDDLLSGLLDSAITKLQETAAWDVQPVTDFDEAATDDERTIIWFRIPLAILA